MDRARVTVLRKTRLRSPLFWAGLTVAPWVLAVGLIVSFTAEAGQEPVIGATRADLTTLAPAVPEDLVPRSSVLSDRGFDLPVEGRLIHEAHLVVGDAHDIETGPDETEPRIVLKVQAKDFPIVDRSHKGDPAVGLRPTFDTELRRAHSLDAYRLTGLVFGDADPATPPLVLTAFDAPSPFAGGRLQPLPPGLSITTKPSWAAASPQTTLGSTTPQGRDGSTPLVARAVSLASATPAPADATPVEIAALPKFSRGPKGLVTSDAPEVGIAPYHPDYAALIDGAKAASEQHCLAEAIYFEARSEPEEGQAAVAQVVLNRVVSGLYPQSVCSVVFQNQQRHNACQFSFACEGHALHITEPDAWGRAERIAREVTEGSTYVSDVGDATHYHADYVRPTWSHQLTRIETIGRHVFYKLKPGQT